MSVSRLDEVAVRAVPVTAGRVIRYSVAAGCGVFWYAVLRLLIG